MLTGLGYVLQGLIYVVPACVIMFLLACVFWVLGYFFSSQPLCWTAGVSAIRLEVPARHPGHAFLQLHEHSRCSPHSQMDTDRPPTKSEFAQPGVALGLMRFAAIGALGKTGTAAQPQVHIS